MRYPAFLKSVIISLILSGVFMSSSAENYTNSKDAVAQNPIDKQDRINVAVLLYNGALILDYGIAAEMFLAADFMRKFNVFTVSRDTTVTLSIVGSVNPDYTIADAPAPDVIIVPGGPRWKQEAGEAETIEFLRKSHEDGAVLYSICTGSLLLAKAGFLENKKATTNRQALQVLKELSPSTTVVEDKDYVDNGDIITTAGAGTAMDATLHLIERLADSTAASDLSQRYLDYRNQYSR